MICQETQDREETDVAPPLPARWFAAAIAVLSAAGPALSQDVLLAEDHGAMSVVVAAARDQPCVMKDGKVKQIATKGYRLEEVPEYLPVYVTVTDVLARS